MASCKTEGLLEMNEPKKYRKSFYNHYTVADDGAHILFNGFKGSLLAFSNDEIEEVRHLLTNGFDEATERKTAICEALIAQGFLIESDTDEIELIKMGHWSDRYRTDVLSLVILPTLKCNFRCVYCYESFPNATMDDEAENRLIKYVANRIHRVKSIPISWFGGEPLTQFARMYRVTRRIQDLIEESGRNIQQTTSFTSNCYLLTPEKYDELKEMNLTGFQVTIDGTEDAHNQLRVLASGGPTYETIVSNLIAFSESDLASQVRIAMRVNCNKTMMESVTKLLNELPESLKKITDVYFRNIWLVEDRGVWKEKGMAKDPKLTAEDSTELHRQASVERDVSSGDMTLLNRNLPCVAADNKNLIIGPDAEIYKCTLELDPGDHVGRLNEDGEPEFETAKYMRWAGHDIFMDRECLDCKNLPTCMGGCFRYRPRSKVCTLDTDIAGAMQNKYEAHIKNQMVVNL